MNISETTDRFASYVRTEFSFHGFAFPCLFYSSIFFSNQVETKITDIIFYFFYKYGAYNKNRSIIISTTNKKGGE